MAKLYDPSANAGFFSTRADPSYNAGFFTPQSFRLPPVAQQITPPLGAGSTPIPSNNPTPGAYPGILAARQEARNTANMQTQPRRPKNNNFGYEYQAPALQGGLFGRTGTAPSVFSPQSAPLMDRNTFKDASKMAYQGYKDQFPHGGGVDRDPNELSKQAFYGQMSPQSQGVAPGQFNQWDLANQGFNSQLSKNPERFGLLTSLNQWLNRPHGGGNSMPGGGRR